MPAEAVRPIEGEDQALQAASEVPALEERSSQGWVEGAWGEAQQFKASMMMHLLAAAREDEAGWRGVLRASTPMPSQWSPFQLWLLECEPSRLDRLLILTGLLLLERPAHLLIKSYREALQPFADAAELKRLLALWPGARKSITPLISPDSVVDLARQLTIEALTRTRPFDTVWSLLAKKLKIQKKINFTPFNPPIWWHATWIQMIDKVLA